MVAVVINMSLLRSWGFEVDSWCYQYVAPDGAWFLQLIAIRAHASDSGQKPLLVDEVASVRPEAAGCLNSGHFRSIFSVFSCHDEGTFFGQRACEAE